MSISKIFIPNLCVSSQIKKIEKILNRDGTCGWDLWVLGGVKNFSVGICDGAPSTARSSSILHLPLVLQDEWLTIFTRPANMCTCPLKPYTIKNVRE